MDAPTSPNGAGARGSPLNVVWICADDFTPDACGAYGNTLVQTPHLDRLARQGIRFDRAFCTCPLSTPSRQSFWTGRYPRTIGVTLSPTPLPAGEITLPVMLRQSGYEVAAFGKTHYYRPRRHEFDICVDWQEYDDWIEDRHRRPVWLDTKVLGPWMPFVDPPQVWLNSGCLPYAAEDSEMFGTFLASRAAAYLAAPKSKPFFLYVSFYETHSPFWFPVEFCGRHDPIAFRVPPVSREDYERLPPVFRPLSDTHKQGIMAAYATSTEFMDKNVGLVLDALDRSGQADRTLVIFTSDHGYLLGQHGRFEKHCCFDPAVRAALIMRTPDAFQAGQSTAALVELIDLTPTILDFCAVPVPANLQGRSLGKLLRDPTTLHREHVIAEYADNEEAMIRTDRWKLIYSSGARWRHDGYAVASLFGGPRMELYDLVNDPQETTNLAYHTEHAGLVEHLATMLADHLERTARESVPIPPDADLHDRLAACLPPCDDRVYI